MKTYAQALGRLEESRPGQLDQSVWGALGNHGSLLAVLVTRLLHRQPSCLSESMRDLFRSVSKVTCKADERQTICDIVYVLNDEKEDDRIFVVQFRNISRLLVAIRLFADDEKFRGGSIALRRIFVL